MKKKTTELYFRFRFVLSIVVIFSLFGVASFLLVSTSSQRIESPENHLVNVYVDGKTISVPTKAKTVAEFIAKSNLQINEQDTVEPDLSTKIEVNAFRVRISRARSYTVMDGKTQLPVVSSHTSARLIAESAGLKLANADKVDFRPIDTLSTIEIGRVVEIVRSKLVTVGIYGSVQSVNTNASTVADLLKELQISPALDDEITPSAGSILLSGSNVFVNRKGIATVTVEEPIIQETQTIEDAGLTIGSTSVRDPGKPGKKVVTYEIATENGVEISRREISSAVIEQPITKVAVRGRAAGQIGVERTQLMAAAGISPDEYAAADFIMNKESGWCATKWQGQYGQCPSFYEEKYPGAEGNKSLGYGLCQSTPGEKMATAGDDWRTNPVTQLRWCTGYARSRYGGWNAAYESWVSKRWW
jgi:resuscitation-promoting factor RpfB